MTYTVAAYRGQEDGIPIYRFLGTGLSFEKAMQRIMLSSRLWPEMAQSKAYAEQLGEVDILSISKKLQ